MAAVSNSITEMRKEIRYNRANRDYDLYLDGQYVGSASSYSEGEHRLNEIVFEALTH